MNITTESWLAAAWLAGAGDPTATSWIGRFCNERPTVVTRTRSLAPSSWRRNRTDSGCVVQVAPLAVSNGVFNWSGAAASVTLSPAPFGGSASARLPDSSAIDATSPAAATAAIIPSLTLSPLAEGRAAPETVVLRRPCRSPTVGSSKLCSGRIVNE